MTDVTLTAPATVTFVTTDSNNAQTTTTIHIAAPTTSGGVQVVLVGSATIITTTDGKHLAITAAGAITWNGVAIPGGNGSSATAYDPATGKVYGKDAGGSGWYEWNKSMTNSTWTPSTFTA